MGIITHKKAMKAQPLPKGKAPAKKPLPKGKKSFQKSLPKGSTPKVKKSILKKSNLEKLGKFSLVEKIKKASEEADNPEEAAANLKDMMNKSDHSKAWSKHNIYMKSQPAKGRKEFDKKSRTEKGKEVALYMIKSNVPKFMHWKESLSHNQSLAKREQWKSEVEMRQAHGDAEFEAHVHSGRFEWREDPFTWGVYNYRDRGDIIKETRMQKSKEWARGQEYEGGTEDEAEFDELMQLDNTTQLHRAEGLGEGLVKRHGFWKRRWERRRKRWEILDKRKARPKRKHTAGPQRQGL